MTDKEQKIREEVERLYNQSLVDVNRQAELGLKSAACTSYGKSKVCKELLSFIDSLQEEPKPKKCMFTLEEFTEEDRKVLCEDCDDDCEYAKKVKPVSEELEEAVNAYIGYAPEVDECSSVYGKRQAFKAGAKWQKEQFENNRLKHCNSITNEQAELEQGFIDQHLDKHQRIPTFLDAIEYGMQLQKEQMMAKAVDGEVTYGKSLAIPSLGYFLDKNGLDFGDKVKLVIIKED